LHATGHDREALRYARSATRLGTKDARLLFHRGMIETALGRVDAARRSLRAALAADPHFSPLQAPIARRTLATLGRS
jgi:Flp pilus assembly protein TadD